MPVQADQEHGGAEAVQGAVGTVPGTLGEPARKAIAKGVPPGAREAAAAALEALQGKGVTHVLLEALQASSLRLPGLLDPGASAPLACMQRCLCEGAGIGGGRAAEAPGQEG